MRGSVGQKVSFNIADCATSPTSLASDISHEQPENGLVIFDTPIVNGSASESVTDDVAVREGVTGVIWERGLIGT